MSAGGKPVTLSQTTSPTQAQIVALQSQLESQIIGIDNNVEPTTAVCSFITGVVGGGASPGDPGMFNTTFAYAQQQLGDAVNPGNTSVPTLPATFVNGVNLNVGNLVYQQEQYLALAAAYYAFQNDEADAKAVSEVAQTGCASAPNSSLREQVTAFSIPVPNNSTAEASNETPSATLDPTGQLWSNATYLLSYGGTPQSPASLTLIQLSTAGQTQAVPYNQETGTVTVPSYLDVSGIVNAVTTGGTNYATLSANDPVMINQLWGSVPQMYYYTVYGSWGQSLPTSEPMWVMGFGGSGNPTPPSDGITGSMTFNDSSCAIITQVPAGTSGSIGQPYIPGYPWKENATTYGAFPDASTYPAYSSTGWTAKVNLTGEGYVVGNPTSKKPTFLDNGKTIDLTQIRSQNVLSAAVPAWIVPYVPNGGMFGGIGLFPQVCAPVSARSKSATRAVPA